MTKVPGARLVAAAIVASAVLLPPQMLRAVPAGRWVTVKARPGAGRPTVTKFVTQREREVVAASARMVRSVPAGTRAWEDSVNLAWHIEDSVASSATWNTQRAVLDTLAGSVVSAGGLPPDWRTDVVIARSQDFIDSTLRELRCSADLSRTGGNVLMGATLCGRHVIVMNLTGFLFLVRADQQLTPELESRVEPPVSRIPYRLNVRNPGALAHEFAHLWRAAESGGMVHGDEPSWFAEGFAEYWAGVASVASRWTGRPYATWHVLRMRDFVDWQGQCGASLSTYDTPSTLGQGCEYHAGLLAVEYLFSRLTSVADAVEAIRVIAAHPTFAEGFREAFGQSLAGFEAEADRYLSSVRTASRMVPPRGK